MLPMLARMTLGFSRSVPRPVAKSACAPYAVGGAQQRAQVAGLLEPLDDDDECVVRQRQISEALLLTFSYRHDAVGFSR
jgi:hypothetical protein